MRYGSWLPDELSNFDHYVVGANLYVPYSTPPLLCEQLCARLCPRRPANLIHIVCVVFLLGASIGKSALWWEWEGVPIPAASTDVMTLCTAQAPGLVRLRHVDDLQTRGALLTQIQQVFACKKRHPR